MPSEVVQKENVINVQVKELVETKATTKENGSKPEITDDKVLKNDKFEEVNFSEETKADGEIHIKDKSEDSNGSEESSESENKENKEPSDDDDQEIQKKRAEELLVDGKRHLVINDYQAAADVLSEACSLFGTVYGEMAEECAEAYFKYGCALLELSKDQMSPVGLEEKDEVQEESVTEINVSSEKEKMIVSEKKNEVEQLIEINEIKMCVDKEKLNEVEEKSTEEKGTEKMEKSADDENPDKDENPGDEDIEEDDVNDLQLAWEMLDLAKVIYKNKDTEESKLKLAEVLMKCGEVSIEDEQFETAIDDMTESLQIRR